MENVQDYRLNRIQAKIIEHIETQKRMLKRLAEESEYDLPAHAVHIPHKRRLYDNIKAARDYSIVRARLNEVVEEKERSCYTRYSHASTIDNLLFHAIERRELFVRNKSYTASGNNLKIAERYADEIAALDFARALIQL